MIDREKVIKGLEACSIKTGALRCLECPYTKEERGCTRKLHRDILSLLKEQEEIKPKQVGLYGKEDWYGLVCVCPDCKAEWMSDESETHFCPNCGQEVKWNG